MTLGAGCFKRRTGMTGSVARPLVYALNTAYLIKPKDKGKNVYHDAHE